jgi:DNA-binding NarL/FixJ family response regulator
MKIIVVDDHIAAQETVTVALASDPGTKQHMVTGVRTPDELHRIDELGTFGLAFVDLDFRRQSAKTGLFALRLLDRVQVPAVIYAADDEDNRVLFLLAAFRFYRPWALVSKRASGAEIRKLVATIAAGARPDPSATQRYQPPARGISVLDRLIVRAGDIPIWRALATQSDRNAIAEVTDVSRSKVDSFLNEHSAVVAEIEQELLLRTPAEPSAETRAPLGRAAGAYAHRFAPLRSFAVEHHRFFQDAEILELIKERGDVRLTAAPHITPRRRR